MKKGMKTTTKRYNEKRRNISISTFNVLLFFLLDFNWVKKFIFIRKKIVAQRRSQALKIISTITIATGKKTSRKVNENRILHVRIGKKPLVIGSTHVQYTVVHVFCFSSISSFFFAFTYFASFYSIVVVVGVQTRATLPWILINGIVLLWSLFAHFVIFFPSP